MEKTSKIRTGKFEKIEAPKILVKLGKISGN